MFVLKINIIDAQKLKFFSADNFQHQKLAKLLQMVQKKSNYAFLCLFFQNNRFTKVLLNFSQKNVEKGQIQELFLKINLISIVVYYFERIQITGFQESLLSAFQICQQQSQKIKYNSNMADNVESRRQNYNNDLIQDMESSERFQKLSSEKVAELHESKLKMLNFIDTLGDNVDIPKKNPVSAYCEKFQDIKLTGEEIEKMLNQRIQKQFVFQHRMMKNQKVKKNWGKQDVYILVWTLVNYMNLHKITSIKQLKTENWEAISELIPGTTGNSCMFKLLNLKKIRISQKKWTSEQEQILNNLVSSFKNQSKINWRIISEQLFLINSGRERIFRTAKQCKEHWASFLNEEMKKGPWHYKQDIQMLQFIFKNKGRTKWASMAKRICSRTENALKNRYNLIIKQEKKYSTELSQMGLIKNHLQKLYEKYSLKPYSFGNQVDITPHKKTEIEDQIYQESEQKQQPQKRIKKEAIEKTEMKKQCEQSKEGSNTGNPSLFMPLQSGAICPVIYPTFIMFSGSMFSKQKND